MIEIGQPAPDFEAKDSKGETLRLSSLKGKKVVLYFFPKAFTTGCTIETRQFATLTPGLAEKGVQVVGVSVDQEETLSRFAGHCGATFPIVSDSNRSIARAYGVLSFLGLAKRATFFLDEEGIVRDVVVSMMPGPHTSGAADRFGTRPPK